MALQSGLQPKTSAPGTAEEPPKSDDTVHALVLTGSGFGASSCYGIGVMKGLLQVGVKHNGGQVIDPQIYAGTVFSAFNIAIMASCKAGSNAATLDYLERLWLDEITGPDDLLTRMGLPRRNGVYRLRMDPRSFFDPRTLLRQPLKPFVDLANDAGYLSSQLLSRLGVLAKGDKPLSRRLLELPNVSDFIDTSPLEKLLEKHVDLHLLRSSGSELRIVATDWVNGEPAVFDQADLTYQQILASLAIFALFPRPIINGHPIAGGGIASPTPIQPAIDAALKLGAKKLVLHVVYLRPRLDNIDPPEIPSTFDTFNRLTYLQMKGLELRTLRQGIHTGDRRKQPRDNLRITAHCYRPKKPLWDVLEVLDYSRDKAQQFMEQGLDDAINHDCEVEGCALDA
ncbi:MAG: patatin-like phospholipase family protein [Acidobacteriota bacterium]